MAHNRKGVVMNKGYEFFGAFVVIAILLSVFAYQVKAETLISYDDGSTYTVGENERVYVASKHTRLFTVQTYSGGNVYFYVQAPWSKRDYVEPETTGSTGSTGSFTDVDKYGFSQACADFDTSVGFTFGYLSWQKMCDTNNDGEYNICDYYEPTGSATFADVQYNKQCLSGGGS